MNFFLQVSLFFRETSFRKPQLLKKQRKEIEKIYYLKTRTQRAFKKKERKGKTQIGTKRDFLFLRVVLYAIVVSFFFILPIINYSILFFKLCFKTQNRIIKKERKEERK